MKKIVVKSILINFFIGLIFVLINNWAIEKQLEETFVFLAISYGVVTIIINAFFVGRLAKE